MSRMCHAILYIALCISELAIAAPFSSLWNWENQPIFGRPKTIVVERASGNAVEEYNERGQKIRIAPPDTDESSGYETTLEYNQAGDLVKITVLPPDSREPLYVETAVYENKGILKSVTRVRGDKRHTTQSIIYDENGHLLLISIRAGENVVSYKFKFDVAGNLLEKSSWKGNKEEARKVYSKYVHGSPKVENHYFGHQLVGVANFEYEFDSKGNWIRKIVKADGPGPSGESSERSWVITRKIVYY